MKTSTTSRRTIRTGNGSAGGKKKTNTDHFLDYFPVLKEWIRGEQVAEKACGADDMMDQPRRRN